MENSEPGSLAVMLGRWQPVHLGHVAALHAACRSFDHVLIGLGSFNIYDYRNPFLPGEVEQMLSLVLKNFVNYEFVAIADFLDDDEWCSQIIDKVGDPDVFFTANPYVTALLKEKFQIQHPAAIIPQKNKTPVSATMVRRALARGEGWQVLLPESIVQFIDRNQLDVRFRQEFGLQTLMMDTIIVNSPELE